MVDSSKQMKKKLREEKKKVKQPEKGVHGRRKRLNYLELLGFTRIIREGSCFIFWPDEYIYHA